MTFDNKNNSTTSGGGNGIGIGIGTSTSSNTNDINDCSSLQQQQSSYLQSQQQQQQQQHTTGRPLVRKMISNINPAIVKTGIFGASSNLINAIVGAGIIGIPYAIMQCGIVIGILLLPVIGYLTHKSLCIIVNIATFHPLLINRGVLTYEDLMYIPFGTYGKNFILCNMFIMAYGAMIAYLLIIKDTIPILLGYNTNDITSRNSIMFITSFCIVVPLSMMRDISQLSCTSCISVVADIALVLIVVYYSPYNETINNSGGIIEVLKNNWINSNVFIGLGVISTAMACQHSAFLISGSFSNHTIQRWSIVTSISLSISTLLTILLGLFGYLGFLNNTYGDILLNFQNEINIINVGRLLLAITMFLTYPMESFVARHVIIQLLYNGNMDNTTITITNGEIIEEIKYCYKYFGRREIITLIVYVSTLVPALFLHDLGPVLSITGSLGASCISYIAPGLIYIGMNGTDFLQWVGATNTTGTTTVQYHHQQYKRNTTTNNYIHVHDNNNNNNNGGIIELPTMNSGVLAANIGEASLDDLPQSTSTYKKPWWWYIALMPIWVYIASIGENGIQRFFTEFDDNNGDNGNGSSTTTGISSSSSSTTYNRVSTTINDHSNSSHNENDPIVITQITPTTIRSTTATTTAAGIVVQQQQQQQESIGPNRYDYCFSIFFIIFGVIAAIAGLTSNIWAIIQNVRS